MSSERANWSLRVRDVLRAVLRAPSRRSAVALISAAVQDFPCRILATHFDASAMVVIFAMIINLIGRLILIVPKPRIVQRPPSCVVPKLEV